jgi:hypothetical protein
MAKSKRHLKHKKRGTKSKRRTMKGGECPCKNRGLFSGGFGAASYQGGLDKYIQPLNSNVGGDPNNPTNMMSERFSPFVGGKKSRKHRRKRGMKGGNAFFPVPDALKESFVLIQNFNRTFEHSTIESLSLLIFWVFVFTLLRYCFIWLYSFNGSQYFNSASCIYTPFQSSLLTYSYSLLLSM